MAYRYLQQQNFSSSLSQFSRIDQQTIQGQPEVSDAPRLYFSTGSHLYEILYHRTEIGYQEVRLRDEPLYRLDFLSPLRELPFHGDFWHQVVGDIGEEGGHGAYFHLSLRYDPTDALGNFRRVTHSLELPDVQSLVLIRPSHMTQAIAELLETYGELWYVTALDQRRDESASLPPEPSDEIQQDEQRTALYDVFARGRYGGRATIGIRLLI